MRYGCQIWGQTRNQHVSDVVKLQKKAVRIINCSDKYTSQKPLFNEFRRVSFDEIVNLQNCVLVLMTSIMKYPKPYKSFSTLLQHKSGIS